MKSDTSKKWINAAIEFLNDPKKEILCPNCGEDFLAETPVVETEKVSDIYLHCNKCKAYNVLSIAPESRRKMYEALHDSSSEG